MFIMKQDQIVVEFSRDEIQRTNALINRQKRIRAYMLGICLPSTVLNVIMGFLHFFGLIIPWGLIFFDIFLGIVTGLVLLYVVVILTITQDEKVC